MMKTMKTLIHYEYDVIQIICFNQNQNLQKSTANSQRDTLQRGISTSSNNHYVYIIYDLVMQLLREILVSLYF